MFRKIERSSFFRVNELSMNNEKSVSGELHFLLVKTLFLLQ